MSLHSVHIPDDNTERTPLVGSIISTDGTFSTITLDSDRNGSSQQQKQQQQQQGRSVDESNRNKMALRSSSCLLLFFVTVAFVAGIIQWHYGILWGAGMNALLVITGTASLIIKEEKFEIATATAKNVHFATLYVWAASAIVGLVLFLVFVALHGQEILFHWCLFYSGGHYLDYASVTMNTCAALSEDGSLQMIWIAAVIIGAVMGLPFMYITVQIVYWCVLYAEASSSSPPPPLVSNLNI